MPACQTGVGKFRRASDQNDQSTALAPSCGMLAADAESKMNIIRLKRTVQIWKLATRDQLAARNKSNLYPCSPPVTRCRPRSTSKIDYLAGVPDLRTTYVNRPDNDLVQETSPETSPDSDYNSM